MDSPIRLHWLDPQTPEQPFPPVHLALREPNGLLALGGDLSPERLLRAYAQGIFPWFNPDEPILWWSPDPRAALEPDGFHLGRSLAKRLRNGGFEPRMDTAFEAVIRACAGPRGDNRGTWLGDAMQAAYIELFHRGYAHSLEVWRNDQLVGGLYGLAIGRMFYGESMFSREPDASKLALYWLCQQLSAWRFELIDCQVPSPHLERLGVRCLPRSHFLERARPAAEAPGRPGRWTLELSP